MIHPALLFLAVVGTLHASSEGLEGSPPPLPWEAREFLQAHNKARAAVGVQPLRWSPELAYLTTELVSFQRDKMGCQFANLTASKYGFIQHFGRGMPITPRIVVKMWLKYKQFYNYANNTCVPNHMCSVYKQLVWWSSLLLGCAQSMCDLNAQTSLTICFYDPRGNIAGQRPY
ncbi:hypothetical protein VNO77_01899 [Canavalia gladiata]|uniref:SCP domain-containing protein n=1 Tax=Canavalia gladiata TaxID=3824 RepID=A0AAN9R5M3_CANGL